MSALTLRLFGPGVLAAGGTVIRTHSARTFALLVFLVLEPARAHAREALVELLWSDLPPASGRQGLRQALHSLRTVAAGALARCLQADPKWIRFDPPPPDAAIDIDVLRFEQAVGSTKEDDWREAAALQRAPLLDGGAEVPGAAWRAWLDGTRDRLRALAMQNLERLVLAHMARSEWDAAAGLARSMSGFDPTSEVASRLQMRAFAALGQSHALEAEWTRLRAQLSQALGAEPAAETAALHRALRPDRDGPTSPAPRARSEAAAGRSRADAAAGAPVLAEAQAVVRAGQAAERVFAYSHAAELYDRALQLMRRAGPAAAPECLRVLLRREAVLERLGRRTDQALVIDEAMSIAHDLRDPARVAAVQLRRAGVCAYLRQHAHARAAAEQALMIFRDIGDAPGQAEALRELGFVHWHAGDCAEALRRTQEALELHRRIGDVTGEATALHNLAEILRGLGSPKQATQWFEQAMRLHWAARNPLGEILSLFGWAGALRQAGDTAGAAERLGAALKLSETSGERVMHSRVLHALSMQHAAAGALDAALVCMRRAIEIDRAIGYAHALGHDLMDIASLHLLRGEHAEARVAMQEALVWYGFTADADASEAARARLAELDAGGGRTWAGPGMRGGIKSHLSLGEGKVYCEFESPIAAAAALDAEA